MKCATAAEMRAMDQRAVHAHGISETELMQRAAQAMLDALCAHYGRTCRYGIFCGCGNNGGDGYALGELMADAGISLTICARDGQLSPGAAVYAERAAEKGVRIAGMDQADEVIADSDVLVDALFGTGISREMSGADAALADRLNESGKPVAAVDIPSGMHADGEWMSAHTVKAELTVTFVCLKEAMLRLPQREWCGKIEVRPIGMPPAAVQCADPAIVLDDERVRAMLPRRMPHSHKGTYGRVLLIAGSLNMSGAPRLCAQAILRAGAGLLTCMIPAGIHDIVASAIPEAMYRPLAMDENGQIAISALPQPEQLRGFDLIVIGNGMGRGSSTRAAVQLALDSGVPCILDGDALYEA
ncbi:MAG: NAD(P)H-hydrate epimerase, partial [Merdibacter sp.]|nr:NAD(P)H-hydrate epimerase [Merdibacter sp.]